MKTTRLLLLLCIIVTTLHAQESESLYESGDIKIGIAAMPLLDLGNGYSGIAAKQSLSFYISERFAVNTAAFVLFPQDIEQENGIDAEVQAYGFLPSWRLHAINSNSWSWN